MLTNLRRRHSCYRALNTHLLHPDNDVSQRLTRKRNRGKDHPESIRSSECTRVHGPLSLGTHCSGANSFLLRPRGRVKSKSNRSTSHSPRGPRETVLSACVCNWWTHKALRECHVVPPRHLQHEYSLPRSLNGSTCLGSCC